MFTRETVALPVNTTDRKPVCRHTSIPAFYKRKLCANTEIKKERALGKTQGRVLLSPRVLRLSVYRA